MNRKMSKTIETAATFLVLIFVAVTVWAQYPKDETIDPYGMPVKDRILVQEFDCRGAAASQWKALHESRMIATESRVVVLSSGQDPYILMPGIAWPEGAPRTGTFELEIWMTNTMNPKGEIFWATETKPDFNADAATRFSYSKEDDTFVCVRFETDAPLTRLRFDPGMSEGVCELKRVRLKHVTFSDEKVNHTPEYDPNWADAVERWITISDGELSVQFDAEARGARIFRGKTHVGDVYPFAQLLESLPRADKPPQSAEGMHGWNQTIVPLERGWTPEEIAAVPENEKKEWEDNSFAGPPPFAQSERKNSIEYFRSGFLSYKPLESIEFWLENEELHFEIVGGFDTIYGPVFRPRGEMQQAVLCGVEYLEKGEHSSSTADIETEEHLRHAPKKLDVTWPFMAVVTDQIGFGLYWKDLDTSQPVFATPDFICGDPKSHYMGLHSEGDMAGTLKINPNMLRKTN